MTTSLLNAPLVEVFTSVQGEGAFVGEPQSFVRLAYCPLRCRYCDSEHTWEPVGSWTVKRGDEVLTRANPASIDDVLEALAWAEANGARRTVSLTGGEPLAHPEFLRALVPELKRQGRRVHLETAGVHANALDGLLALVDHVSADFKIASTMETGNFADAHRGFFARCVDAGTDLCVKCVVTPGLTDSEFDAAVGLVADVAPASLFVVQPVTPRRLEQVAVEPSRIEALASRASARLPRVRAIPQVHRMLGLP